MEFNAEVSSCNSLTVFLPNESKIKYNCYLQMFQLKEVVISQKVWSSNTYIILSGKLGS